MYYLETICNFSILIFESRYILFCRYSYEGLSEDMHTWFFLYDEKVPHSSGSDEHDYHGNDDDRDCYDHDNDHGHAHDDGGKYYLSSFKGCSQARSRWSKTGKKCEKYIKDKGKEA